MFKHNRTRGKVESGKAEDRPEVCKILPTTDTCDPAVTQPTPSKQPS